MQIYKNKILYIMRYYIKYVLLIKSFTTNKTIQVTTISMYMKYT